MSIKLAAGQNFPVMKTNNIHGKPVSIPASEGWVHLQFRRFAGCPICNLHLQEFIARYDEIVGAGVQEVVIFHSNNAELLPFQGRFPFDVVGDPEKKLYRQYGVETSLRSILSPGAWGSTLKGNLAQNKPAMPMMPTGGILGLPADFLIASDGTLKAVHFGKHADDHWSVDEMISLTKK